MEFFIAGSLFALEVKVASLCLRANFLEQLEFGKMK